MENNTFKENTLGYAALNMIEEIKDEQGNVSYALKKTEDVKKILQAQEARGANLILGTAIDGSVMHSINIEAAIQAYLNNQTDQLNNPLAGKPIVDRYRITCKTTDDIVIESAIMKAISVNMSHIEEGTLSSTRIVSDSSNNQTNNKAGIKDSMTRTNLPVFEARKDSNEGGIVTKNLTMDDAAIGTALDFGDLADYNALNTLISSARNACEAKTIETYKAYGKTHPNDHMMYKTALRLQNRKLLDSIFEEVYSTHYPEPDVNDKENYKKFVELRKRFHANLTQIGQGSNLSPYTYKLGVERIDVVTSKTQDVTSFKRIGSVKKNEVNSYVHIKPQDTGICTAVFASLEARDSFINTYAVEWMRTASQWICNEARHMLRLGTTPIDDKDLAKIIRNREEDITAAECLCINPSDVSRIEDEFLNRAYELSEKVISEERLQIDREIVKTLGNIQI